MNLLDLDPQLANNREYWLGWGVSGRPDESFVLFRSGMADAHVNGVLRITAERDLAEAVDEAHRRLDTGCPGCGGSARTALPAPPRVCFLTGRPKRSPCP